MARPGRGSRDQDGTVTGPTRDSSEKAPGGCCGRQVCHPLRGVRGVPELCTERGDDAGPVGAAGAPAAEPGHAPSPVSLWPD